MFFAAVKADHGVSALIFRLLLDEASGNLADSSGNGHTFAPDGPSITYQQGALRRGSGGGESIDLNSEFLKVADDPDFAVTTAMTYSCWFNSSNQNNQGIGAQDANTDTAWFIRIAGSGVLFAQFSADGTATTSVTGTTLVDDDLIHHVVLTFSGSTARIYLDGVLEASSAFTGPIFNSTADFTVGAQRSDNTFPFVGNLSDSSFWNEAWTSQEVAKVFSSGIRYINNQYDAEVAKWDAEHGSATWGLELDQEQVSDDVGSKACTFEGGPAFNVFNAIGTKGQLGMTLDAVDDRVDCGDFDSFFASDSDIWFSGYFKKGAGTPLFLFDSSDGVGGMELQCNASNVLTGNLIGGGSAATTVNSASASNWNRFDAWYDSTLSTFNVQLNAQTPVSAVNTGYTDTAILIPTLR